VVDEKDEEDFACLPLELLLLLLLLLLQIYTLIPESRGKREKNNLRN
jgi:hypothetical protein